VYWSTPNAFFTHVSTNLAPERSLILLMELTVIKAYSVQYTFGLWLQVCAGRESLGTSFLVASSPSKQTLPCLDSKRCTGFLRIKDPGPFKLTQKTSAIV
jgi:hypothetical protein